MKARKEVKEIKAKRENEDIIQNNDNAGRKGSKPRNNNQEIDETLNDVSSHELSSNGSNETENNSEALDVEMENDEVGGAVVTIQAGYRGYQGRKKYRETKEKQTAAAVTIQ